MRVWCISTSNYNSEELTMCRICGSANDTSCFKCEVSVVHNTFALWCRDTLFTLLCARKRLESPFSLLDIQLTSRIYAFSISSGETPTNCILSSLSCGHKFHAHCLDGWIRTGHSNCPLCSRHFELYQVERRILQWRGMLKDCPLYTEPVQKKIKHSF